MDFFGCGRRVGAIGTDRLRRSSGMGSVLSERRLAAGLHCRPSRPSMAGAYSLCWTITSLPTAAGFLRRTVADLAMSVAGLSGGGMGRRIPVGSLGAMRRYLTSELLLSLMNLTLITWPAPPQKTAFVKRTGSLRRQQETFSAGILGLLWDCWGIAGRRIAISACSYYCR